MSVALAVSIAAAALAAEGGGSPAPAPPSGAFVLSVFAGPAWVGGRVGVGGLTLDDVVGRGGSIGAEVLLRTSPRFALGLYAEGTADLPAPAGSGCGPGIGRGCDGALTRYGALGRWSFLRAPRWEGWATAGLGGEEFRISRYGEPALLLRLHGWELAGSVGLDGIATRRLGLGLFASASGGVFTWLDDGTAGTGIRGPHYSLHAGVRGVVRAGTARFGAPGAPSAFPTLAAPRGTALSVEGRLGGAGCGFCGAVLGLAVKARSGPIVAGAFAEGSAIPAMDFAPPTPTEPKIVQSARFVGALAGVTGNVSRRGRLGIAVEGGLERGHADVEWYGGAHASRGATVPFAGARATLALRFVEDGGEVGIAAFVREPLRAACVEVPDGCDRLGTTVGVVLEGSIALLRRGTEGPLRRGDAE